MGDDVVQFPGDLLPGPDLPHPGLLFLFGEQRVDPIHLSLFGGFLRLLRLLQAPADHIRCHHHAGADQDHHHQEVHFPVVVPIPLQRTDHRGRETHHHRAPGAPGVHLPRHGVHDQGTTTRQGSGPVATNRCPIPPRVIRASISCG